MGIASGQWYISTVDIAVACRWRFDQSLRGEYSGAFSIIDPEIVFKLIQQKSIKNFQFPTVTLNLVSSSEEFGTLIYLETNNSLRILLSIKEGGKASVPKISWSAQDLIKVIGSQTILLIYHSNSLILEKSLTLHELL